MIKYATFAGLTSRNPEYLREANNFREFCTLGPFGASAPQTRKQDALLFSAIELHGDFPGILAVTVAMFDFDNVTTETIEAIRAKLNRAKINHCFRSTWSDMPNSASCRSLRLAVELSRPALVAEWGDVWDEINTKYLGGRADPGCSDASRKWYAPSHKEAHSVSMMSRFDGDPFVVPDLASESKAAPEESLPSPPSETKSLIVLSGPEGVQIRLDGRAIDIPKGGLEAFADLMCRLATLPPCHGQLEFTLRKHTSGQYDTYREE